MSRFAVLLYPSASLQEITCLTAALSVWYGESIDYIAGEDKEYRSEEGLRLLPTKTAAEADPAGYDCVILPGTIDPLPAPGYKVGKFPFTPLKDREAAAVTAAARAVGLEWDAGHTLWQRDKELWLFPLALEPLFGKVRFSRIGVRLAELHNKGYRWQHEAVIAFAAPQRAFELSQEEAEEWYRGRDVYPQTAPGQDETIVTFQGVPLGLAKRVGSRLKNSYPRELVRDGKLFAGKV